MKTLVTFYILLAACVYSDAQSAQRVIPNSTELTVDPSWRITAVDGGAFFKLIDQDSFKKWVVSLAPSAPVTSVNGQQGAVTVPVFDSNYNSLKNKPVLFSGAYADLTGKPVLFSGAYNDLTGKPTLFSGNYNDLSNKPVLAPVATSGSYNDLTNKPTIPAQNVYNNGAGIGKTGTEPNVTFYVDTVGKVMTVSRAADSIQSLKNDVNGKVPQSRTLQIVGATPGTAQTLNNDISWTLSKSTVGLGNVDNTSDANKPISTATQTALNGKIDQAGARSAISLTTTGTSGAATYNSSTGVLNVPNYATNSFTRGTGTVSAGAVTINASRGQITYASNIIAAGDASITFTNEQIGQCF